MRPPNINSVNADEPTDRRKAVIPRVRLNLYPLDEDPVIAARSLCDDNIQRLPLESGLLLVSAAARLGFPGGPWKPTNHGGYLQVWMTSSRWAWDWSVKNALALLQEHELRFKKPHKGFLPIKWASRLDPTDFHTVPFHKEHRFHPAVPGDIRNGDRAREDVVGQYREYYRRKNVEWHRRCRVHHLSALARSIVFNLPKAIAGPGDQPRMLWRTPERPRPEWLGPEVPMAPSQAAIEMMRRWCESKEGRLIVLMTAEGDGSPPRPSDMIEHPPFADMAVSLAG